MIREAIRHDLDALLKLYAVLDDENKADDLQLAESAFERIAACENQHLLVAQTDYGIAGTLCLTVIESLTHSCRPYGVVEHVVTSADFRGKGIGGKLIARAEEIAKDKNCYKLMLITGRQELSVHSFYKNNGFSSENKTAYVKMF